MKTDTELQHDVSAELQWDPAVHAARLGVLVKDGIVTLTGDVDSFSEKWHAERAAQRVDGVSAMTSEVVVRLPSSGLRTDADIAASIGHALAWNTLVPEGAIQVLVESGQVTLSGETEWHFQREAAADSVRHLMGVTGVSNQIGLKPRATVSTVKDDIATALTRSAASDAQLITVAVKGDEVILGGTVHSWHERDAAVHAAWASPGVARVIDQMHLAR